MFGQLKDWMARQSKTPVDYPCRLVDSPEKVASAEELSVRLANIALFTYRQQFACLPRSTETSDKGWGCLIRTGQMLLHEAMKRHTGGADPERLLLCFRDVEDEDAAIFSIHNMVRGVTNTNDKFKAGYWSPQQGSTAIKAVLNRAMDRLEQPVMVHLVPNDGSIFDDQVNESLEVAPTLILAPITCGGPGAERLSQPAWMTMKYYLECKFCCGIVGGSPKRSYYFIGTTESDRVLYLDPHIDTQPAFVNSQTKGKMKEEPATIPTIEWKRIDVSMTIGFYIRDAIQWKELSKYLLDAKKAGGPTFLHVQTTSEVVDNSKIDEVEEWE